MTAKKIGFKLGTNEHYSRSSYGYRQTAICNFSFARVGGMSKHSRDLKSLLQNDHDLRVQYNELLRLRAELARLLSLKRTPSRKQWPRAEQAMGHAQKSVGGEAKFRSALKYRPQCCETA